MNICISSSSNVWITKYCHWTFDVYKWRWPWAKLANPGTPQVISKSLHGLHRHGVKTLYIQNVTYRSKVRPWPDLTLRYTLPIFSIFSTYVHVCTKLLKTKMMGFFMKNHASSHILHANSTLTFQPQLSPLTLSQGSWLMHTAHCPNVVNICNKLFESPLGAERLLDGHEFVTDRQTNI